MNDRRILLLSWFRFRTETCSRSCTLIHIISLKWLRIVYSPYCDADLFPVMLSELTNHNWFKLDSRHLLCGPGSDIYSVLGDERSPPPSKIPGISFIKKTHPFSVWSKWLEKCLTCFDDVTEELLLCACCCRGKTHSVRQKSCDLPWHPTKRSKMNPPACIDATW